MFCHKRTSGMQIVSWIMGAVVMVVGIMTVLGYLMSKCDWLRRRTRHLACECGDAVGDATVRIAHAVDDCMTMRDDDCNADPKCNCDGTER